MFHSVSNNNGGAPITADGTYCTCMVPGYIPPEIAGQGGSNPRFSAISYHLTSAPESASSIPQTRDSPKGTLVTFEGLGSDGVWRALSVPAPITLAPDTDYHDSVNGSFASVRLAVTNLAGDGITYAELSATPSGFTVQEPASPAPDFDDSHLLDLAGIRPMTGQLLAPNAGIGLGLRQIGLSRTTAGNGGILVQVVSDVIRFESGRVCPLVNLDMLGNNRLLGLVSPTLPDQATNKAYVDSLIGPLAAEIESLKTRLDALENP